MGGEQAPAISEAQLGNLLDSIDDIVTQDGSGPLSEKALDRVGRSIVFYVNYSASAPVEAPGMASVDAAEVTLQSRIAELVEQHGSLRAAARVMEIDAGYLSRLASGEKSDPGETLLRRMGLKQNITYSRATIGTTKETT